MKTEDLIVGLARDAGQVRRLRHPWRRATLWFAATTAFLGGVLLLMAPPDRLTLALGDLRFSLEQLTSGLVGLTASAAALATVVPGYGRRVLIGPIAAGLLWVAIVAIGDVQDLLRYGPSGATLHTDWPCVVAIVGAGILPAITLVRMLRRGAPLTPRLSLALAALSAASLANIIPCLVRPHDTGITVLLWHGTTVLVLCGVAGMLGSSILTWAWPSTERTS
jgi:hypothetical protein